MMWALRTPEGRLFLVSDDLGVDLVLDEWDRSDAQLLARDGVYDEWRPADTAAVRRARESARRARLLRSLRQIDLLG